MAFVRAQIEEIRHDVALRIYGSALSLAYVLTAVYWLRSDRLAHVLTARWPICWPSLESCGKWRLLSTEWITALLVVLAVVAGFTAFLFLVRSATGAAYAGLCLLVTSLLVIVLQDYRLLLNQHYMTTWVTLSFLGVPRKRSAGTYLLVAFYVWAASLKFNSDWLSGAGLYGIRPLGMPANLVPIACAYVIVLECVLVFGVLARQSWLFWTTFAQLLLFHVSSFWVVGFFYPILMFLFLSILPLARVVSVAGRTGVSTSRPVYCLIAAFSCAQLWPYAFPGDKALTGEGRPFALHMFDAPIACRASVVHPEEGGEPVRTRLRVPFLTARLSCDPLVYFSAANDICAEQRARFQNEDFTLEVESRRSSASEFRTTVSIDHFCGSGLSYSLWHHNSWILTSGASDVRERPIVTSDRRASSASSGAR